MSKIKKREIEALWQEMYSQAKKAVKKEPVLNDFFYRQILQYEDSFQAALAHRLATRLPNNLANGLDHDMWSKLFQKLYTEHPELIEMAAGDILAVTDRDPAAGDVINPFLYFKGYHAVQLHRLAHILWNNKRSDLALLLQSLSSEKFGVDIHPGARLGHRLMIDHATGVVIGETAVVGDGVSILHGVTLGGTGKKEQDRHPKIGNDVLIGANATVLGNIIIGDCSRIAAGSMVLMPVPPNVTVAGVPAKIVGASGCSKPGELMNQILPTAPETQGDKSRTLVGAKH